MSWGRATVRNRGKAREINELVELVHTTMPVKPLAFKGDPKQKKRNRDKISSTASSLLRNNDDSRGIEGVADAGSNTISYSNFRENEDQRRGEEEAARGGEQDSSWVNADQPSDLSGPVVLVLPAHPTLSALACDDLGAVFVSELQNVDGGSDLVSRHVIGEEGARGDDGDDAVGGVGGGGGAAGLQMVGSMAAIACTAEPDDVRQVWVVSQIRDGGKKSKEVKGDESDLHRDANDDEEVKVSFKGSNGRYLGCSTTTVSLASRPGNTDSGKSEQEKVIMGGLKADAVAVGPAETFRISSAQSRDGFLISNVIGDGTNEAGPVSVVASGREMVTSEKNKTRQYITIRKREKNGWQAITSTSATKSTSTIATTTPSEAPSHSNLNTTSSSSTSTTTTPSPSTIYIRMQARFKPRLQAHKAARAKERISRRELETAVGRRLEDDEVRRLKRARRKGEGYHEEVLDVRIKGKHDKFA